MNARKGNARKESTTQIKEEKNNGKEKDGKERKNERKRKEQKEVRATKSYKQSNYLVTM